MFPKEEDFIIGNYDIELKPKINQMNTEKDVLKKCLDYIIVSMEYDKIEMLKNIAIRSQSFEIATNLRELQLERVKNAPTLEEFKNLRELLN